MINFIKKFRYILFFGMIAVGFLSCLDEIEFDPPAENVDSIAIQGRLVKGSPHKVEVNILRIYDFSAGTGENGPIRVSYVRLFNDQGQSIDLENESLGKYEITIPESSSDFVVEDGGSFKLEVQTLDNRNYESSFEILHPVSQIDNISTQLIQREVPTATGTEFRDGILFLLDTPLSIAGQEDKARINWQVTRTYQLTDQPIDAADPKTCYISENINIEEVKPFDGNILGADFLTDYELYETNLTYHFREGFYLNVFQQSLSRGAYQYWNQIDKVLDRTGNMFDAPVGEIASNFRNTEDANEDIFGYFYATAIDTANVWVDPSVMPAGQEGNYCPPPVPPPPGGGCAVEVCCDCLAAPISTTSKPEYWEF